MNPSIPGILSVSHAPALPGIMVFQSNMAFRYAVFPVVFLSVISALTIAFVNRKKLIPNFDETREKQKREGSDKAREFKRQLKEGVEEKRRSGAGRKPF